MPGGAGLPVVAGLLVALVAGMACGQSVPVSGGGGEGGLWTLWTQHLGSPDLHAQHAEGFHAFAARRPLEPLAPVAQTLEAWHLLKLERAAEAKALLETLAAQTPADATGRGARELSRAWLTCLDRESVVVALDLYRVREVRYPERLADLEAWPPLKERPPFQDRWANRWEYRMERLRSMPSLEGQRYSLGSRMLGDVSSLKSALALKYAERILFSPVQVRLVQGRPAVISLLPDGAAAGTAAALVMAGSSHEGVMVAYASTSLVILHDRLHWKIALTPKR